MIRLRRSLLYIPASSRKMLEKAPSLPADGFILDLEDGVALSQKATARDELVRALREIDFGGRERVVRINGLASAWWRDDLAAVVEGRADTLLLPKASSADEVREVEAALARGEARAGVAARTIGLALMIENPAGVADARAIAAASPRVNCLIFGSADYTKETRGRGTPDRIELLYPLNQILLAARLAGADALDAPCFTIRDEALLRHECGAVRALGFDGKTVIHPSQIGPVNAAFAPDEAELAEAHKVIAAYEVAEREGRGVIDLDGRLIEALHVTVARRTLGLAAEIGKRQEAQGQKRHEP